jgi:hypothetical protein
VRATLKHAAAKDYLFNMAARSPYPRSVPAVGDPGSAPIRSGSLGPSRAVGGFRRSHRLRTPRVKNNAKRRMVLRWGERKRTAVLRPCCAEQTGRVGKAEIKGWLSLGAGFHENESPPNPSPSGYIQGRPKCQATESVSKTGFNGIGGLRAHIGFVSVLPGTFLRKLRPQLAPALRPLLCPADS